MGVPPPLRNLLEPSTARQSRSTILADASSATPVVTSCDGGSLLPLFCPLPLWQHEILSSDADERSNLSDQEWTWRSNSLGTTPRSVGSDRDRTTYLALRRSFQSEFVLLRLLFKAINFQSFPGPNCISQETCRPLALQHTVGRDRVLGQDSCECSSLLCVG